MIGLRHLDEVGGYDLRHGHYRRLDRLVRVRGLLGQFDPRSPSLGVGKRCRIDAAKPIGATVGQ